MKGQSHSDPATRNDRAMAMLGHELDNVLNGLLGLTQLLRESGLSPEQDRWSRAIEQSGWQLRQLVSTFRSGRSPVDRGPALHTLPVDAIDLLEQVLISHAPAAAANGNRLLLTVEAEVPGIWHCDPCRLRQVIDNLLANALKFTRGGEVRVHAARSRHGPDRLHLSVVDSGPGIDPAAGKRIFEAWEQGHEHIRRDFGGSGLGLFICRSVVAAMGGTLRWTAPASGGARFEAQLPGMFRGEVTVSAQAPSLLRKVHCVLELREPVRGSVAGWLARLGVRWHDACATAPPPGVGALLVGVSEIHAGAEQPGPTLLLTPLQECDSLSGARSVAPPILGCSLGPVLLGMVLEWLWVRRDRRDSIP